MKQQLKTLKLKLARLLKNHQAFVVIVGMLLVLIAVVMRLNTLGSIEPDQAYIDEQVVKIKVVRFDEAALSEIQALRESNVTTPGTDLSEDRQNPFSE